MVGSAFDAAEAPTQDCSEEKTIQKNAMSELRSARLLRT